MENVDRCVCCGEIVPEGQMVCPNCMVTVKNDEKFILFLETQVKWLRKRLEEVEQERDLWKSAALYYMEKAKTSSPRFLLKSDINVSEDMLKTLANSPVVFSTSEGTIIPLMPGRWIPVTERLPEDDLPKGSKVKQIKVLTALKSDKGVRTVRSQMRFRCTWYRDTAPWEWKLSGSEITHWMPLPEPPKEGWS